MLTHVLALLTSVAVVIVKVHARPFPCGPPPLPRPTNDLTPQPGRDLQQTCCYPEMRSPPTPSMPNPIPPPNQDPPSLQPPFFFPETKSHPPPPYGNLPSPQPPYLEKGHSPPTSDSKFIHKLIIATIILAAILVLLALSKWIGLDLETIKQAIGLSVAVTTFEA